MGQTITEVEVDLDGSVLAGAPESFGLDPDISDAQQVIDEMQGYASKSDVIRDWMLVDLSEATIYVSVCKDGVTTRASW